jgi:hypothetical protein
MISEDEVRKLKEFYVGRLESAIKSWHRATDTDTQRYYKNRIAMNDEVIQALNAVLAAPAK